MAQVRAGSTTKPKVRLENAVLLCVLIPLLVVGACSEKKKKTTPEGAPSLAWAREDPKDPFSTLGLMVETTEDRKFALPRGPMPPRRIARKMDLVFPPPLRPKAVRKSYGLLQVLRTQPTGQVGRTATVTVTFNHPMVPLTSLDRIDRYMPAFSIKPALTGRFRWLGTNVAAFETRQKFPFSTRFTVTIPASTRSAVGGRLEKDVSFSFETPRVKLVGMSPSSYDRHALPETALVLHFDQGVRGDDVLAHASLEGGKERVELGVLARKSWNAIPRYGSGSGWWNADRTVVLKPRKKLKKDTAYVLSIKPGLSSMEGPLRTTALQSSGFKTYGAFKVLGAGCYSLGPCSSGESPTIKFTNPPVANEHTLKRFIQISPRVPKLRFNSGASTYMSGQFQAGTTYRVTVRAGLEDEFGQKLARSYTDTIRFEDLSPDMVIGTGGSGVVEGRSNRRLGVHSVNVTWGKVTMVEVEDDKIFEASNLLGAYDDKYNKEGKAAHLAGRRVKFRQRFNRKRNRTELTLISVDRLLRGRGGTVFVEVESGKLSSSDHGYGRFRWYLLQVTDLGITVRYDKERIITLVSGLGSGRPVPGASLTLFAKNSRNRLWEGKTGPDGMASMPGVTTHRKDRPYLLTVRHGKDRSFVMLDGSGDGYISAFAWWRASLPKRTLRVHMFTDRDPYRPKDKVEIVGILRTEPIGHEGRLERPKGKGVLVEYRIHDPRGQIVAKGRSPVDSDGVFHLSFRSSPDAVLGTYSFHGQVSGVAETGGGKSSVYHYFKILAFRAPEHETSVRIAPGHYYFGDTLSAAIQGRYLFGAPMANAETRWTLHRKEGSYHPPGHDEFFFGIQRRWWYFERRPWGRRPWGFFRFGTQVGRGGGKLDRKGMLQMSRVLYSAEPEGGDRSPAVFTLEAQVIDANRQSVADRVHVTAHPSSVYVGLRLPRSILKVNEEAQMEVIAVDPDGKRVTGRTITITATIPVTTRMKVRKGRAWTYEEKTEDVEGGRCRIVSSASVRLCRMSLRRPGYYTLRAESLDDRGRKAVTRMGLFVFGKGLVPWRQENRNSVDLRAGRKLYRPGEKARVLIRSPFAPSVGILAVERKGIRSYRYLDLKSSTQVEEIALDEQDIPNVWVSAVLVRGRIGNPKLIKAGDPGRPMYATGRIKLDISTESRRIRVDVRPARKDIRPGEKLNVRFVTRDHEGKPVSARLAVMVVDEGVLSLLGFKTPDPMSIFYHAWGFETALEELRELLLKKAEPAARGGRGIGGYRSKKLKTAESVRSASGAAGGRGLKFKTRTRFATTAFFSHKVKTGADGAGELVIQMPENLTAFRIMAVAQDAGRPDRFGSSEARVRIRKALLLRPALPRFANFGDRFEAAVVINNETGKTGNVTVKLQGVGIKVVGPNVRTVTAPNGAATEVRFPVAVIRPGRARFRFSAFMGRQTDSVEPAPIPVLLPATTEAFAVYGTTGGSVAHPVMPPAGALIGFGGMNVSLSSTALTGMQDAVEYLVKYPYGCAEQTASRLIPIFALKEILPEFKVMALNDRKKIDDFAMAGMKSLLSFQYHDGGFGFWPGSQYSSPYVSVYVTWALLLGRRAGYPVPDKTLLRASRYLSRAATAGIGRRWHPYYSTTVRIMAAWLLSEMRSLPFISKSEKRAWGLSRCLKVLYPLRDKVGLFAKAWLLAAIHRVEGRSERAAELMRRLENAAIQTPSGVHFAEAATQSLRLLLHSDTRTDAVVLGAFMEAAPKSPIIPKIVRALMAARVRGRWESTQANAFVLEALARYFKAYERTVPNFKADLWYGEGYAGTASFRGRSMEVVKKRIPMGFLLRKGKADLVLAKNGPGKLYYRLGLSYAPRSLRLLPREEGFVVHRRYEPVAEPKSVVRLKTGIWQVKAGSYVRIHMTVVVPDRRYYVALDDPLAAGLEGVDLGLRTTASSALRSTYARRYRKHRGYPRGLRYGYPDHREMRDERHLLFFDSLDTGVYEFSYLVRATTIGRFVIPPAKVMEMYHPEVFGRTGTEIMEVVPAH